MASPVYSSLLSPLFYTCLLLEKQKGANTLTFIIPAEIFPTCYRCTCHGISAAAGKVGSIVAVLVVYGIDAGYASPTRQGLVFLLFGSFMALGAVFSWAYLPDVQREVVVVVEEDEDDGGGGGRRGRSRTVLENRNLEDLGEGREKARLEGQVASLKDKWAELKRRRRPWGRGGGEDGGEGGEL